MENKNLLERYNKTIRPLESYQERMALSLQFITENYRLNIEEGSMIIDELIKEAQNEDDLSSLAELYFKKAWVEIDYDRFSDGGEYLLKSLELFMEVDNKTGVMGVHTTLGYTNSIMGNPQEGFKHYQEALRIAEEINAVGSIVPIYGNMAADFLDLKRYKEALFYYKKAAEIEQPKQSMSITLEGLGNTYHLLGEDDKALPCLKEAYKIAEEEGLDILKGGILTKLANVYKSLGKFKEAEIAYKEGLSYGRASGLPRLEINATLYLGIFYKERGQLNLAYKYLKNAYKLALKMNIMPSQLESLKHMWQTLIKSSKWEEAFNYLKMFHEKHIEYHNRESFKEIDRLKMGEALREKELFNKMRKELSIISEIGKELTSSLEVKEIMEIMRERLQGFMESPVVGLGFYDEKKGGVAFQFFMEGNQWFEPFNIIVDKENNFISWCINNRKEIFIKDFKKEYSKYVTDISKLESVSYNASSLLYVPLLVRTKVIGVLSLQNYEPDAYSDYQLEIFKALASYVAIAFENARLYGEVKTLATTDPLTGIYNRRSFMDWAKREFERYKRYDRSFCMVMIDLDYFKEINDLHGHAQGDLVLKKVALYLSKQIRRTDLLCRYGGEEFLLLFPDMSLKEAMVKANNLKDGLSKLIIKLNTSQPFSITASFGVSKVLKEDKTIDNVVKRADMALYEAKAKGRNRVVCNL